ncbi:Fanconi anemia group E protein isoform X1 [Carcharodon carcharias]|uniref:Fanconi anemia group E protein isoform X1 n=1 Tax=Carcharodon carcharias TaxID=13397 RepID=UPI001B7E407C|nr:Fanconi anemia group E protein isoform X1 [Carcharodon carcharias]
MKDYKELLEQFEKPFQILLHALIMGVSGATTAFHILQRIQSKQPLHWRTFIETLCQPEPWLEGKEQRLSLIPLFYLLPVIARRNLLSFLHLGNTVVPKDCLHHLIVQLRQNPDADLWTQRLIDTLEQDIGDGLGHLVPHSHTEQSQQQWRSLCQKLMGISEERSDAGQRFRWYFSQQQKSNGNESSENTEGKSVLIQNPKKRKNFMKDASPLDDGEQNATKKIKLTQDTVCPEPLIGNEKQDLTTMPGSLENGPIISPQVQNKLDIVEVEQKSPLKTEKSLDLPEHVKSSVSRLRDLFEADSDKLGTSQELNILNECDPSQLEKLCLLLRLSELPEHHLPLACNRLISLSSDLSYSNATVLARNLFLTRVLSLTEPASRFLMAAITSFCKKYARPSCNALIEPLLQAPDIGNIQVELICRLTEDCLEQEHLTVTFGHILSIMWSEEILSVVHTLLERRVEVTSELFEQFVQKLSQHAGIFNKSMKYAKVVLAALSKYQIYITTAHKNELSCALALHKTFLKKSMQAALKHIVTT